MKMLLSAGAAACALIATSAEAQQIVAPTSATASSTFSAAFSINNTINQSGLSTGYVSGVTNFDAYVAGNPLHSFDPATEWFTAEGITSASVTYDLGSALTTDRLALWNEDGAGIGAFTLWSSIDNIAFAAFAGFAPANNPDVVAYGPQVFSYTATNARFLRLNISVCPQPGNTRFVGCGIGEVAFRSIAGTPGVPEPATWAMLLLGFGGLGYTMRRRSEVNTRIRFA